jgi:hypothetical protein
MTHQRTVDQSQPNRYETYPNPLDTGFSLRDGWVETLDSIGELHMKTARLQALPISLLLQNSKRQRMRLHDTHRVVDGTYTHSRMWHTLATESTSSNFPDVTLTTATNLASRRIPSNHKSGVIRNLPTWFLYQPYMKMGAG